MRRQHGRRAARYGSSGHSLFGSTGWLFADLLLALALAFLLATTVIVPQPKKPPSVPPGPTATRTHAPVAKKTGHPEPALNLTPIPVNLTIDPNAVSAGAIQQVILADPSLRNQRAGLVIVFAGGDVNSSEWGKLDKEVWGILKSMGSKTPLFDKALPLKYWGGGPLTQILLKIYLYKTP